MNIPALKCSNAVGVKALPTILFDRVSPQNDLTQFSKALNRFSREDPTFRVSYDDESKEVRNLLRMIHFYTQPLKFHSSPRKRGLF